MKRAFVQLHIAVFLAGVTGVLGRVISLNEGLLVWYRLLITAVTLWVIMLLTKKIQKIPQIDVVKICGVGFLAACHWVFFYASIKYSNISVGLVCLSAVGFFSAILEPIITKQKIDPMEVIFGILSILGIYLIFHFDTMYKLGIVLGIISSFFASLFPILLKLTLKRASVQTVLTWQMTGGLLSLSLIMPMYLSYFPVDSLLPTMHDFFWLLVLSWVCSVIAFQFSLNALTKLSAFTVGLSYNLEPFYGILMAFIFFKENKALNSGFYMGFTVISLTLVLHMFLLRKKHRAKMRAVADAT